VECDVIALHDYYASLDDQAIEGGTEGPEVALETLVIPSPPPGAWNLKSGTKYASTSDWFSPVISNSPMRTKASDKFFPGLTFDHAAYSIVAITKLLLPRKRGKIDWAVLTRDVNPCRAIACNRRPRG
jgi:hypothetical protein